MMIQITIQITIFILLCLFMGVDSFILYHFDIIKTGIITVNKLV